MKRSVKLLVAFALFTWLVTPALAMSPEELAKESEAYVQSTAKETPTMPATIIAKVEEACAVLSAEGAAAYPKFKGKGSPFLYDGTYIWIHSLAEGNMLMHPIKDKLEGKNLISMKDKQGKRFFVTMNDLVSAEGQGWVDYMWPVPGSNDMVRKVSFVKKCTYPDGTDVVIGSGIYNGDEAAMAKLTIN